MRLRRKPSLTVRLEGTAELLRELLPATVTLQAAGDTALHRKADVTAAEQSFELVPPAVLRCVLEAGPVKLEQRADLSAGEDGTVTFVLDPFEVSGRVTHGGKQVRGEVEFRGGVEETRVKTEADGTYSARLWQPGKYVVEVWIVEPRCSRRIPIWLISTTTPRRWTSTCLTAAWRCGWSTRATASRSRVHT